MLGYRVKLGEKIKVKKF